MSSLTSSGPAEILVIEDNPGDVRLIRETFREIGLRNRVYVVSDAVAAQAFLRREGKYSDAPRPDLILLDLSLPGNEGLELLAQIKTDGGLRRIPVVVLTSSASAEDMRKAYDLGANSYITKPAGLEEFFTVVESVVGGWLSTWKLPREREG